MGKALPRGRCHGRKALASWAAAQLTVEHHAPKIEVAQGRRVRLVHLCDALPQVAMLPALQLTLVRPAHRCQLMSEGLVPVVHGQGRPSAPFAVR